jgi:hypothetical protein
VCVICTTFFSAFACVRTWNVDYHGFSLLSSVVWRETRLVADLISLQASTGSVEEAMIELAKEKLRLMDLASDNHHISQEGTISGVCPRCVGSGPAVPAVDG